MIRAIKSSFCSNGIYLAVRKWCRTTFWRVFAHLFVFVIRRNKLWWSSHGNGDRTSKCLCLFFCIHLFWNQSVCYTRAMALYGWLTIVCGWLLTSLILNCLVFLFWNCYVDDISNRTKSYFLMSGNDGVSFLDLRRSVLMLLSGVGGSYLTKIYMLVLLYDWAFLLGYGCSVEI